MSYNNQLHINKLLDFHFEQPNILCSHLFGSFHQFIDEMISFSLIHENNYFYENVDKEKIYLHGFKCSNIRIKPVTNNDNEIIFPSDARKNHLNYFATVIADIQQFVEIINTVTGNKTIHNVGDIDNDTHVANIPIMIKSKFCSTAIKNDLKGECKYDPGGYFIVNGAEKIVLSIEKIVDNKILIFSKKDASYPNGLQYIAQINSKINDWSDNLQILMIKYRKDGVLTLSTSSQLVDIPLFILMRALGVESDESIISYITYDLEDTKMINLIRSSVTSSLDDEGNMIKTKEEAIEYLISKLRRNKRISQTDENIAKIQKRIYLDKILRNDLLSHLGDDIPKKIVFLGFMANKLLNVILGNSNVDDRDALQNKRIELPGILLGQLFRQNWKKLLNEIGKNFKKKNQSDEKPINVINQIKPSIIEQGIKTALATGTWGMNKTKKGVAQSLQRPSWIHGISYLRRIMSPSMEESTSKVTSIRKVNNNQTQLLCPVETPEGAKIGIVKSLAMTASITLQNASQCEVIDSVLKTIKNIFHPYDINPLKMNEYIKIFMNGNWLGVSKLENSYDIFNTLKQKRREDVIDKNTSILIDIGNKEIRIYSDGGRLFRPLLIVKDNKINITDELIKDINNESKSSDKTKSWKKILVKYPNIIEYEDIESLNYLMVSDEESKLETAFNASCRKVEYKDNTKINRYGDYKWINYTHADFHQWTMLGTVASNIPFANHNYGTRNIIFFSQAKQSIGIYLSSYKDRMDISQILYHPQVPLVQTQGMKYNGCLDLPFGENAIVAICSYTGYNQEDSLIFNQSAIDRGIFRADSIKKDTSIIEKNPSTSQDDIFTKPDRNKVTGMKQGSYEKLNDKGYVPEETEIANEDIIIGKISPMQPTGKNNKVYKDSSKIFKSNIPGVIDRVHTGIYNAEGYEMYNMRIRMERKPIIGDKFSCYDDSHQVLTTIGWINIKDITLNHKVATLQNNWLEYQNPIAIQNYDYTGQMYLVETDNVSLCVTPNHRMLIKHDREDYTIKLAQDIINKTVYFKSNVDNIKPSLNLCFQYNDKHEITHYVADEYKWEIYKWLDIFANYISQLSELPEWVWCLSKELCTNLIYNILRKNDTELQTSYVITKKFVTKKYKMCNDFIRLCLHGGFSASYKQVDDKYIVMMNTENNHIINNTCNNYQDKYVDFSGKVYCCSVMGEGIIYVRRNGIPVWCGNSRHAQKGTIGIVYPQKDMPFTESGIVPDLILNPHGFPSRMSVAHFIETLAAKEAAETGHFVDGTPFNNYDITQLPIALKKLGYSPYGTEVMTCGITGRKMDAEIFIGPSYNIRLKHMVQDKVHGRARGPKQALTRQPLEGRSKDGGLKIGKPFCLIVFMQI
jgi:DNA-directed RNA polymerase II subunit RPB2